MFEVIDDLKDLDARFRAIGLEAALIERPPVLVKINLAAPQLPAHPRTDARLLAVVLDYLLRCGAKPALCESVQQGSLRGNLEAIGLLDFIEKSGVEHFDIESEQTEEVVVNGETHYVPRRFRRYPVRIAVPCASQREKMLFSNNVKLFVGAVPAAPYRRPGEGRWRSKLHDRLDESVRNVFLAVQRAAPFRFFINGGNAYGEKRGRFELEQIFIGTDAVELDFEIIRRHFDAGTVPDYLRLLAAENKEAE